MVKASIRKSQVEWAIRMPLFCIQDFESVLRSMIEAYDRHSRRCSIPYLGHNIMVSFRPTDFARVFGIPGTAQGGAKINGKPHKMSKETKLQLIRMVCKDEVQ